MKKILSGIFIGIIIIINSCGEGITEPQAGRRDYVWTVDTLDMPMNFIGAIWGSSPKDVWTVGGGGSSIDRLLHYDGEKWKTYTKEPIYCTGETLFGFGAYDVWMGGGEGQIWHYDGQWSKNFIYKVDDGDLPTITDIWGTKPNDIYACGTYYYGINEFRGFVLHYDGIKWKEIIKSNFNSQFLTIRIENGIPYIFSYTPSQISSNNDTITFFELTDNKLKKLYSNSSAQIVYGSINAVNGKVYFLIAQDIYRYINGNFVKQVSLTHQNFGYNFYGRNMKDLFVRMTDGLAHYNGTDLQYLYNFPLYMVSIRNVPILFENEVFFILWEPSKARNMVLHGKLKK